MANLHCPPCCGNCHQGRECPARGVWITADDTFAWMDKLRPWVFAVGWMLVLALFIALAFASVYLNPGEIQ